MKHAQAWHCPSTSAPHQTPLESAFSTPSHSLEGKTLPQVIRPNEFAVNMVGMSVLLYDLESWVH